MPEKLTFRLALLLALLTFVGVAGLNTSVDPTRVSRVNAAGLEITISGDGPGGALAFSIGDVGCPDRVIPADACTARVRVTNTGRERLVLSYPSATESGPLETCSGDDENNPGSAGNNLSTAFGNLSYQPGDTTLRPGAGAVFDLIVTLLPEAGNACQGKTGYVTVSVSASLARTGGSGGGHDFYPDNNDGRRPTSTPTATATPEDFSVPTREPTTVTPTATVTPTPVIAPAGPSDTTVSPAQPQPEVIFTTAIRPPETGSGGLLGSEGVRAIVEPLLAFSGAAAFVLFLLSLKLRPARKDGDR